MMASLHVATGAIRLLLGVLLVSWSLACHAQSQNFCSFSLQGGWNANSRSDYVVRRAGPQDRSGIPQVIARINSALGINPSIDIYIAVDENNAYATVAGGRRIVAVDVDFVESINRAAGSNWGAIQVIAHEIGHHIAGFSADRHKAELNADYWSGRALHRLGASRGAATSAILAIGSTTDSASHPSKYRRAAVIEKGWDDSNAGRVDYSYCDDCRW